MRKNTCANHTPKSSKQIKIKKTDKGTAHSTHTEPPAAGASATVIHEASDARIMASAQNTTGSPITNKESVKYSRVG